MIKIGDTGVSKLYLGDTEIKKAYVGEELVYQEKKGRLPAGYTEVEYIQSSGTQCIDTKVVLTNENMQKISIEMDIETLSAGDSNIKYLFGSGYSKYNSEWKKTWYYNGGMFLYKTGIKISSQQGSSSVFGDYGRLVTSDVSPRRMKLTATSLSGACVNDECASYNWVLYPTNKNILLFTTTDYSSTTKPRTPGIDAKLYSCKIYNPVGTIIRDYVPCISSGGVVGLYDLITSEFYSNFGTGSFSAGPEV